MHLELIKIIILVKAMYFFFIKKIFKINILYNFTKLSQNNLNNNEIIENKNEPK